MNRWVAFLLLLVIVVGCWATYTHTTLPTLLTDPHSPVVFSYSGTNLTQAEVLWVVLIIPLWLGLSVLGFTIDPILGWFIFRLGLNIILLILNNKSSGNSQKSGSGSGRSGRGN